MRCGDADIGVLEYDDVRGGYEERRKGSDGCIGEKMSTVLVW